MKRKEQRKQILAISLINILMLANVSFADDSEIYLDIPPDLNKTPPSRPNIYFLIDDSGSMDWTLSGATTNVSSQKRVTILKDVMNNLINDLANKDQISMGIGAINQFIFNQNYKYKLQGESGPGTAITTTQNANTDTDKILVPVKQYKDLLVKQLNASALTNGAAGTPLFTPLMHASMNLAMVSHNRASQNTCKSKDAIILLSDGEPNSISNTGTNSEITNSTYNTYKYNNYNSPGTLFKTNSIYKTCLWPSSRPSSYSYDLSYNQFPCMQAWSEYISNKGVPANAIYSGSNPSYPDANKVAVYTIFFGSSNATAQTGMSEVAKAGQGQFYYAANGAELAKAFENIVQNVVTVNQTSLIAPSASSGAYRMFGRHKDLFYGYFKPELTENWPGNLKRYQTKMDTSVSGKIVPTIVDKNGKLAFESYNSNATQSGLPIANTISFWSSAADGGNVTKGGALENIQTPITARPLYTYTPNYPAPGTASSVSLSKVKDASYTLFGLSSDNEKTNLLSAMYDQKRFGDVMHSIPSMFEYIKDHDPVRIKSETLKDEVYIALGTNEGYLHIFDTETGKELASFIPKELLKNIAAYQLNANLGENKTVYGMDGHITVDVTDGTTLDSDKLAKAKEVKIYAGMGRGGRNYYAFSYGVNDKTDLKLKWVIQGGVTAGFEKLGQTWSPMYKAKVRWGTTERNVLFFSGGYDPRQDAQKVFSKWTETSSYKLNDIVLYNHQYYKATKNIAANNRPSTTTDWQVTIPDQLLPIGPDTMGHVIYMVDLNTGEKLWEASADVKTANLKIDKMVNSIPGGLLLSDSNRDQLIDKIFFADTGGKVFRIDLNDNKTVSATTSVDKSNLAISGYQIAQLADETKTQESRKFYNAPSVEYNLDPDNNLDPVNNKEPMFKIAIGSGYKGHPLTTVVKDRVYMFQIPMKTPTTAPMIITENEMVAVTKPNAIGSIINFGHKSGWYIPLDQALGGETTIGEKVVAPISINNGTVFATTYVPPSEIATNPDPCKIEIKVGGGNIYVLKANNAAEGRGPSATLDSDGKPKTGVYSFKNKTALSGIVPSVGFVDIQNGAQTNTYPLVGPSFLLAELPTQCTDPDGCNSDYGKVGIEQKFSTQYWYERQ